MGSRVPHFSLLAKFSVLTFLCVAALGAALAILLRQQILDHAARGARELAAETAHELADKHLTPADLEAGLDRREARRDRPQHPGAAPPRHDQRREALQPRRAARLLRGPPRDRHPRGGGGTAGARRPHGGGLRGGLRRRQALRGLHAAPLRRQQQPLGRLRALPAVRADRRTGERRYARALHGARGRARAPVPAARANRGARLERPPPPRRGEPPSGAPRRPDRDREPAPALRPARRGDPVDDAQRPRLRAADARPRPLQGGERRARPRQR